MRIAFVVHDCSNTGGHERYAAEIVRRLGLEHELHLFSQTCAIRDLPCTWHPVWAPRRPALLSILGFLAYTLPLVRRGSFDLIHGVGLTSFCQDVSTVQFCSSAWAGILRRYPDAARVSAYQRAATLLVGRMEKFVHRRNGARLIAVSERTRQEVVRHYGVPPETVRVIYNGVDPKVFHPGLRREYRTTVERELGIGAGELVALFVGPYRRKGLRFALEGMASSGVGNLHLLAVGGGDKARHKELAFRLGLAQRVHLLDPTEAIVRYFGAADLFLLPVTYEPFGMAVLEAMACGLPVIVPRTAGVAELVDSGVNGFVIDRPEDREAIARHLQRLVREPELSRRVGQRARQTACQYSWDYVYKNTLEVYEAVYDSRRRARGV